MMTVRVRTLALALCMAGLVVALTPSPAAAGWSWTFSDSLEGDEWEAAGDGGSAFREYNLPPVSHSGTHYAFVYGTTGWGGIGRHVTLPAGALHRSGCKVSWWVRPMSSVVRLNFEVIDPDTWDYLWLHTVTINHPESGYRPYQWISPFSSYIPAKTNVYVRVSSVATSSGRSWADVDDMTLQCSGR